MATSERRSVPASDFWNSAAQVERCDRLERDIKTTRDDFQKKVDTMRSRSLAYVGIFVIPIASLLGGLYLLADSASDTSDAVAIIVQRHEGEIGAIEQKVGQISETVVEIRVQQDSLENVLERNQQQLLREIGTLKGG